MSLVLSRCLTYATLFMYLTVGTVAVRFLAPDISTITISSDYLNIFSGTHIATENISPLPAPVVKFAEINFPSEKLSPPVKRKVSVKNVIERKADLIVSKVSVAIELPFFEPIILKPIRYDGDLLSNLVALYKDLEVETLKFIAELEKTAPTADQVKDEISTVAAKSTEVDVEPEFFEYPIEEAQPAEIAESKVQVKEADKKIIEVTQVKQIVSEELNSAVAEEVSVNDLVVFDYSAAKQDVIANKIPTVSTVTIQKSSAQAPPAAESDVKQEEAAGDKSDAFVEKTTKFVDKKLNALKLSTYPTKLTIQATSTNFKESKAINGFEVRFQDEESEIISDYGTGEVVFKDELAESKMTRSAVLLKRGFIPTNTDLILEEGVVAISVPLIEEETFNDSIAPYEARGPVGALLVELDDETDAAELDVPFGKVIYLDGDLKKTSGGDFRYQLFMGVRAGNALLSYKGNNQNYVTKIVHVHEREVTFEANYFEDVKNETIKLFEEDLLAKEKTPLIISSEQVKQFASEITAKKINDHTYQMSFEKTLLGGRSYLELGHLAEPTFIGYREKQSIDVPSENFMRFILSRFENAKLGNRCLVQVNLTKKADRMEIGTESVAASLMTHTQVLDSDGKFYDSIGEKSRKIIIVGESQSSSEVDQNGKINIKIFFQDGSNQYLSTYCSPNTYLVEQL